MAYKLIAVTIILGALIVILSTVIGISFAQQNAPFRYSNCPTPGVCCLVPVGRMTQPVPGGLPTIVPEGSVNLFGAHVSNLTAGARYLQFFDATNYPAAGATPIGASSWFIPSGEDRDIDVGAGAGGAGWAFNKGILACCSSTQGAFTPSGDCGFLLQFF